MKQALLFFITAAMAFSVNAASPMDKLFSTVSTAPQSYETQKRMGLDGGSASVRTNFQNENLISFSPPSISAGCGSIDIHLGSINLIKDITGQIQSTMRQIASGAASYAFNVALSALCATCQAHLQKLKTTLNKWNQFFKDGCKAGEALAAKALSPYELSEKQLVSTQRQAQLGGWIDGFDQWTNKITNMSLTDVEKQVNGDTSALEGNLFYEALKISKIDNWQLQFHGSDWTYEELLMSLLGSVVVTADGDKGSDPNNPQSELRFKPLTPALTLRDFFLPQERNTSGAIQPLKLYRCDEPHKCLNPQKVTKSSWKPVMTQVTNILMPAGDRDMLERYRYKQDFTSDQISLIKNSPGNLYVMLVALGHSNVYSLRGDMAYGENFAKYISHSLVDKLYSDAYKVMDAISMSPGVQNDAHVANYINNAKVRLQHQRNTLIDELAIEKSMSLIRGINDVSRVTQLVNGR